MPLPERGPVERIELITQTIRELYGADEAFCVETAVWLMAAQHIDLMNMKRIAEAGGISGDPRMPGEVMERNAAIEVILRNVFESVCAHTGVAPARAMQVAKQYTEALHDLFN